MKDRDDLNELLATAAKEAAGSGEDSLGDVRVATASGLLSSAKILCDLYVTDVADVSKRRLAYKHLVRAWRLCLLATSGLNEVISSMDNKPPVAMAELVATVKEKIASLEKKRDEFIADNHFASAAAVRDQIDTLRKQLKRIL